MRQLSFEDAVRKLQGLNKEADEADRQLGSLENEDAVRFLQVAFAMRQAPSELKVGQIVRGRKELVDGIVRDWERPHIVLEKLAKPLAVQFDTRTISDATAPKRYDCIIGAVTRHPVDGNNCFLQYFADSREWEPFPDLPKEVSQ